MILLFNLDSINKELVTNIARKSYRISHLVAFFKFDNVCIFKTKCVFDQFGLWMEPEPDFDLFTFAGPL